MDINPYLYNESSPVLSNPFLFIYSISQNQEGSFTVQVLFAGRKLPFSIPALEWYGTIHIQ